MNSLSANASQRKKTKRADEILVETIKASNKKLKSAQIVIYILAVLVNALFMIGVPLTATPSDAMAVPLAALFRRCSFCPVVVLPQHQAYMVVYIHSDFGN